MAIVQVRTSRSLQCPTARSPMVKFRSRTWDAKHGFPRYRDDQKERLQCPISLMAITAHSLKGMAWPRRHHQAELYGG
jgi:hypothetical protein